MEKPTITVNQNEKRGPGRPATGRDPAIAVRLPEDVSVEVEALGVSRSDAIRVLLEEALAARKRRRARSRVAKSE